MSENDLRVSLLQHTLFPWFKSVSRSTRITLTSRVVSRMEFEFATTIVDEASAHILVPTIDLSDKHLDYLLSRSPVFYNPRMKMNRDMAVLALRVFGRGRRKAYRSASL